MKLSAADLTTLRKLVVDLFDLDDLTILVADLGYDIETIVGAGIDKEKAAFKVLTAANNDSWIDRFIAAFEAKKPNNPDVKAFVSSLTVAVAAAANPYGVCFADNRPFVNRSTLRVTLRSLITGGPRILVVRGEPRSGKTYTGNLIKYLASNVGFEVVTVNLVKYAAGRDVSPVDIGDALARQMGLGKPPELGNEQLSRWTLAYFDWLVGQLRPRDGGAKTWWIVIDGFQSISVPQAVNDFIDELAARVDATLLSTRVTLISYERELPAEVGPIIAEDVTSEITVDDLSDFFMQFYREQKPHMAEFEDHATTHAAEIAVMMETAPLRFDVMGRELIVRCRKIIEESP